MSDCKRYSILRYHGLASAADDISYKAVRTLSLGVLTTALTGNQGAGHVWSVESGYLKRIHAVFLCAWEET